MGPLLQNYLAAICPEAKQLISPAPFLNRPDGFGPENATEPPGLQNRVTVQAQE